MAARKGTKRSAESIRKQIATRKRNQKLAKQGKINVLPKKKKHKQTEGEIFTDSLHRVIRSIVREELKERLEDLLS